MAEPTTDSYQQFGSMPATNDYQCLLNQTSNLHPKIPSWFRRPAKVTKRASRDSSPRSLTRRRTTATVRAPSRQNSITDGRHHQKHHSTPNSVLNLEARGRPMSWHSTSFQQASHQCWQPSSYFPNNVPSSYFLDGNFTTCEFNGAITPVTHPFAGEPFVQDAFTPLDEMSSQAFDRRYAFLEGFGANKDIHNESQWGIQYSVQTQPHYQFPNGPYETQKRPEYYFHQLEETALPTPDFPPLQSPTPLIDVSPDVADQARTEDLVGMGLYDAPSPMPANTSFLSSPWDMPIRPRLGKGLKLEETFQPTTTEDEDSDTGQGDEDDDDNEDEAPAFNQTPDLTMPYLELEEKGSYCDQNALEALEPEFNANREVNDWWSTDDTADYGWV